MPESAQAAVVHSAGKTMSREVNFRLPDTPPPNFTGGNPRTGYVALIEDMKLFAYITRLFVVCLAAFLLNSNSAVGQIPSGGKGLTGLNLAVFIKLFGSNTNFIARVESRVLDKNQHETTSMPMNFEMLAGSIRLDINMADVKSTEMSPEFAASMKQMGMDQMSIILLTEQKATMSIYPGLKSYAESPMSKEEIEAFAMQYKIEKSRISKETLDGHACDKDNVTITDSKGGKDHLIAWYVGDQKDYLFQIQIPVDDSTMIMKFKDVKLGRPETSRFQPPPGMAKYDNVNALISDAVTKKMNLGAPK